MEKKKGKDLFVALTDIKCYNKLEMDAMETDEAEEIAGRDIYDKIAKTKAIWGNIDVNLNVFRSWRTETEKRAFRKAAMAFWGIEPMTVREEELEGYEVYYGLTTTGSQFVLAKDEREAIKIVKVETGERHIRLKDLHMTILKTEHDKKLRKYITPWERVKAIIENK